MDHWVGRGSELTPLAEIKTDEATLHMRQDGGPFHLAVLFARKAMGQPLTGRSESESLHVNHLEAQG